MKKRKQIDNGQDVTVTQISPAVVGDDRSRFATQLPDVIPIIIEHWRQRQGWHTAEKRLTLQAGAICRRYCEGDKVQAQRLLTQIEKHECEDTNAIMATLPLLAARDTIVPQRKQLEKQLMKWVKTLPIAPWCEDIYGMGMLSLVGLVGECGDIGSYKSVAAVWKRLGLAPFKGKACSTWRMSGGLSSDEWTEAGYNPRRCSVARNVGDALVGGLGNGPRPLVGEDISKREDWSPYQKLFVERLRYEAARDPENMARPHKEKNGVELESFSKHAAARAKRYVIKRFIRELYAEWRRLSLPTTVIDLAVQRKKRKPR
jgi:hypothetical protein